MESKDQSIDSNVDNAASQIHPNELRDCHEEDEKEVITARKESRRTQITCLLFSPANLLSFSTSTWIEISACKPNERSFRLLGSS